MVRTIFEYHPVIGYRFIPNIKVRIPHEGGGYLVKVNSSGFRCEHEFVNEKPSNQKRVLLFGDSFTAGDGVSNKYRFGDILETKHSNLEVYNFGLPGSGTDQQYLVFQEYGKNLKYDVAIIVVFIENIGRTYSRYRYWYNEDRRKVCYAKPYFEIDNGKLLLKNVPPRKGPIPISSLALDEQKWIHDKEIADINPIIIKSIQKAGMMEMIRKIQLMVDNQPYKEYNNPDDPAWKVMESILIQWIKDTMQKGLIILIPSYHFIDEVCDPSNYQMRFSELQSKTGCIIHDTLPDLLQYSLKERRKFRFDNDPHLTQLGHAAIAQSIKPVLNKILSCHGGGRHE